MSPYPGTDQAENWQVLLGTTNLFNMAALSVAAMLHHTYPHETHWRMLNYW